MSTTTDTTTWRRVFGPDESYSQCGDESLFEVGCVYSPIVEQPDEDGRHAHEVEVIYYVTFFDRGADSFYSVECQTHCYTNPDDGHDDYQYDVIGINGYDTLDKAKDAARREAADDDSWAICWEPSYA